MALALVDLPPFVLIQIFKRLGFTDFISLFETTKNANIHLALQLAFATKFRLATFKFYMYRRYANSRLVAENKVVQVGDYALCRKLCNYFGSKIKKQLDLVIVGSHCRKDQMHLGNLLRYISKYCVNLERLKLHNTKVLLRRGIVMMGLVRAMKSVQELEFRDCHINGQFNQMNQWFPNLRSFKCIHNNFMDYRGLLLARRIAHLEELQIRVGIIDEGFNETNAIELLRQNHLTLTTLKLTGSFRVNILQIVSTQLQNLTHLTLNGCYELFNQLRPGMPAIVFPKVVEFTIQIIQYFDTNFIELPFTFPALTSFLCMYFNSLPTRPNPFIEFILSNQIPNVNFIGDSYTSAEVVNLLIRCSPFLQNFSCTLSEGFDFDLLLNSLRVEFGDIINGDRAKITITRSRLLTFARNRQNE